MQVFGRMLLAALVSLSCVAKASVQSKADTRLVFETETKEELTREEMYARLNSVGPDRVAGTLSIVKDKSSTRVIGGLSVEQLLAQNEISTSQCKKRPLRMRVAVCERTKNFTTINVYCRLCLVEAVRFCLEKLDSALVEGLIDEADRDSLLSLAPHTLKPQEGYSEFGCLRTPLEQLVASSNDLERAGSI